MTQDLRDVLQQLHTALANLNTFLETQNQQTTTRGENVGTYHDTSSLPELDEWERLHTLGEAQLQEIRDEFLQMIIQENESPGSPGLQRRYEGFSFFPDTELIENLTDDIKPLNGTLSNDQLQLIKDLWPRKLRRRLIPTYKSDSLGYPIECPLTGPPGPGRVMYVLNRDKGLRRDFAVA
ncbi:hypothetical protein K445DRAFT_167756 [Daldinia sp. EC12]|nr:hypothetical protein K445DRAFT_167756 [Daldinia sp. EC12]